MLKIKNVSKNFGNIAALKNVSFSINKGEIVALLGENGAGKSTLLRIISGFAEAGSGEVFFDKDEIKQCRMAVLQKCGYVQEVSSLYGDMTVFEFLKFAADLRQINPGEIATRIKHSVALTGLQEVVNQRADTLSKGFKKRVELAAVMLAKPDVLLLDEPTEGLDPNQKFAVRETIKKYAKGHIVLLSTHTMEDVEAIASRVVLLHKGQVRADAKLQEFKKTAKNDLSESFRKITLK